MGTDIGTDMIYIVRDMATDRGTEIGGDMGAGIGTD